MALALLKADLLSKDHHLVLQNGEKRIKWKSETIQFPFAVHKLMVRISLRLKNNYKERVLVPRFR